ncbi:hypothetical protein [Streptomyces niveus]|uniref:hypothetical protein n=1 Tax=Streptomyces niveus TaxID=193462 RepID=UPI003413193F
MLAVAFPLLPEGDLGDLVVAERAREVFVLTDDRTSVRRWDPRTGTWTRVGGPAGTLAVTVPRAGP